MNIFYKVYGRDIYKVSIYEDNVTVTSLIGPFIKTETIEKDENTKLIISYFLDLTKGQYIELSRKEICQSDVGSYII